MTSGRLSLKRARVFFWIVWLCRVAVRAMVVSKDFKCPAGYELGERRVGARAGQAYCKRCQPGWFSPRAGATQCHLCNRGTGTRGRSGATRCGKEAGGETYCPPGRWGPDFEHCSDCPAGRFGYGGSRTPACSGLCEAGRYGFRASKTSMCTGRCSAGRWCGEGATSPLDSGVCPKGRYTQDGVWPDQDRRGATLCPLVAPMRFRPARGYSSPQSEAAACVLDKAYRLVELLFALRTCEKFRPAAQLQKSLLCDSGQAGALVKDVRACCLGNEHLFMGSGVHACEKAVAPLIRALTTRAEPFMHMAAEEITQRSLGASPAPTRAPTPCKDQPGPVRGGDRGSASTCATLARALRRDSQALVHLCQGRDSAHARHCPETCGACGTAEPQCQDDPDWHVPRASALVLFGAGHEDQKSAPAGQIRRLGQAASPTWHRLLDPKSGHYYYFDSESGHISWFRPSGHVEIRISTTTRVSKASLSLGPAMNSTQAPGIRMAIATGANDDHGDDDDDATTEATTEATPEPRSHTVLEEPQAAREAAPTTTITPPAPVMSLTRAPKVQPVMSLTRPDDDYVDDDDDATHVASSTAVPTARLSAAPTLAPTSAPSLAPTPAPTPTPTPNPIMRCVRACRWGLLILRGAAVEPHVRCNGRVYSNMCEALCNDATECTPAPATFSCSSLASKFHHLTHDPAVTFGELFCVDGRPSSVHCRRTCGVCKPRTKKVKVREQTRNPQQRHLQGALQRWNSIKSRAENVVFPIFKLGLAVARNLYSIGSRGENDLTVSTRSLLRPSVAALKSLGALQRFAEIRDCEEIDDCQLRLAEKSSNAEFVITPTPAPTPRATEHSVASLMRPGWACPAGKFTSVYRHGHKILAVDSLMCVACPPGTFQPNEPGSFGAFKFAAKCWSCPKGKFSLKRGASSCSIVAKDWSCLPGTFTALGYVRGALRPVCRQCPAGKFQPSSTLSMEPCKRCSKGKWAPSLGAKTCVLRAKRDIACPPGQWGPVRKWVEARVLRFGCRQCPAGRYGAGGSRSKSCTGPCAPGRYGTGGSTNLRCTGACLAGRFCGRGAAGPEDSVACHPAGRYQDPDDSNASACTLLAPPGFVPVGAGGARSFSAEFGASAACVLDKSLRVVQLLYALATCHSSQYKDEPGNMCYKGMARDIVTGFFACCDPHPSYAHKNMSAGARKVCQKEVSVIKRPLQHKMMMVQSRVKRDLQGNGLIDPGRGVVSAVLPLVQRMLSVARRLYVHNVNQDLTWESKIFLGLCALSNCSSLQSMSRTIAHYDCSLIGCDATLNEGLGTLGVYGPDSA